jgi:hypothetical protein
VDYTQFPFTIPAHTAAYIEFNYKSTVPFAVGMQSNLSSVSTTPLFLAGAFRSAYWQKFYFDVTDFVGQYPGTNYNFFISSVLDTGTTGRLLITNIYLVTF